MTLITATRERILDADEMRQHAIACPSCGTTALDGRCLNIGGCDTADRQASRQSRAAGAPRAWTMGGNVD